MFNLQYITMNEICNILRIYKLSQLKAVTESEVIPKSGEKPLTVYPDHLDLELSPDQQDGGLLYKIEQTIPVSTCTRRCISGFTSPIMYIRDASEKYPL